MPFAATIKSAQIFCFPDVCKTPSPAGPIPLPYPNQAMTSLANPPTTKVLVDGAPAVVKSSKIPLSNGDTAGTAGGGVVSGGIMGECQFVTASFKVKFQGKPVVRLGDSAKSNKGNTFGTLIKPSQFKVDCN